MPNLPWVHFLHSILFAFLLVAAHSTAADTNVNLGADAQAQIGQFFSKPNDASTSTEASGHTNNWAVLVCASRYWFNYRVRLSFLPLLLSPLAYSLLWTYEWL